MKQYLFAAVLMVCGGYGEGVPLTAGAAWAHPGRTAADGCHYCRTNCDKWGEVAGARHCHQERQPSHARQNGQPPAHQPGRRRSAAPQAPLRSWAVCPGSSMPIRLKWRAEGATPGH